MAIDKKARGLLGKKADKTFVNNQVASISSSAFNMFDTNTMTAGWYVSNTGVLTTSAILLISDFIPVTAGNKYTITKYLNSPGGYYDANKNWVSKITGGTDNLPYTMTIPANIAFVRLNFDSLVNANVFMMMLGDALPATYVPYGRFTMYFLDKFRSKKLVALGDSITWQDGRAYSSGPQSGQIAVGYMTLLKYYLGLLSFNNLGANGATMVDGANSIMVVGKTANYTLYDLVTILAGTNDYGTSMPMGVIGDVGSAFDIATFYGAYQSLIEYIFTSNPLIKVYLFTPTKRFDQQTANSVGLLLKDYRDAIIAIGDLYSIPVLDLYSKSGINSLTADTYTRDKLHPIDIGYAKLCETILPFVQSN